MERQVSQTSQWSKTCIREGGLGWKNEYSNQVSEIKLVPGREPPSHTHTLSNCINEVLLPTHTNLLYVFFTETLYTYGPRYIE